MICCFQGLKTGSTRELKAKSQRKRRAKERMHHKRSLKEFQASNTKIHNHPCPPRSAPGNIKSKLRCSTSRSRAHGSYLMPRSSIHAGKASRGPGRGAVSRRKPKRDDEKKRKQQVSRDKEYLEESAKQLRQWNGDVVVLSSVAFRETVVEKGNHFYCSKSCI